MNTHFTFNGHRFGYLRSGHNCYYGHIQQFTERIVEMPLVDCWLSRQEDEVWEVGAVTPYYWPGRVNFVIDPSDPHRDVTHRCSVESVDLSDKNVLCVSTLEHIGLNEYGQAENTGLACRVLDRLLRESKRFFATFPTGYNRLLDEHVLKGLPDGFSLCCLVREGDDFVESEPVVRPYGVFANSVFVIQKGD